MFPREEKALGVPARNRYERRIVSAPAEARSCHFKTCAEKITRREAAVESSLPLVQLKGVTETPRLLVEYEHPRLSRKTDFLHLAVFADEHGIARGFRSAVFPASFAFGEDLPPLLYGRFVSVDLQAILTCLQIDPADLCRLGDVNGLAERFCE
jgi:hypothetical protein